jgi:hypothetical protein
MRPAPPPPGPAAEPLGAAPLARDSDLAGPPVDVIQPQVGGLGAAQPRASPVATGPRNRAARPPCPGGDHHGGGGNRGNRLRPAERADHRAPQHHQQQSRGQRLRSDAFSTRSAQTRATVSPHRTRPAASARTRVRASRAAARSPSRARPIRGSTHPAGHLALTAARERAISRPRGSRRWRRRSRATPRTADRTGSRSDWPAFCRRRRSRRRDRWGR